MKEMEKSGVKNPMVIEKSKTSVTAFKTGKPDKDNVFPVVMEFIKSTSSDGKADVPDGTKIFAHATLTTIPEVDSVTSEGWTDEMKDLMKTAMKSMFSQLNLPDREVKVGEEFSQETPMNLPIASISLKMTIKTTYKLVKVVDGKAYFDIVQTYIAQMDMKDNTMNFTGDGKGKLIYDVKNEFNERYQLNSNMNVKAAFEGVSMDMKMNQDIDQVFVVKQN
jgi:hypothetical protein